MPFRYEQKTGRFFDPSGKLMATGYSGHGPGVNNPKMEGVRAVGPIPRGTWDINPTPYDSQKVGKFALILEPKGHTALGRTAFRIHGDSIKNPGTASNGCIILPPDVRRRIASIAASGDRTLEVVEG